MKKKMFILMIVLSFGTVAYAEDFTTGKAKQVWEAVKASPEGGPGYLVQTAENMIEKGSLTTSGSSKGSSATELIDDLSSFNETWGVKKSSFKIVRAYRNFDSGTHMHVTKLIVKGTQDKLGVEVASVKLVECRYAYSYDDLKCEDRE